MKDYEEKERHEYLRNQCKDKINIYLYNNRERIVEENPKIEDDGKSQSMDCMIIQEWEFYNSPRINFIKNPKINILYIIFIRLIYSKR